MSKISTDLLFELEYLQDNMNLVQDNMNLMQVELGRCVNSLHVQSQQASQILVRLMKVTTMVRAEQGGNADMNVDGEKKRPQVGKSGQQESDVNNWSEKNVSVPEKEMDMGNCVKAPLTTRPALKIKSQGGGKKSEAEINSNRASNDSTKWSQASPSQDVESAEIEVFEKHLILSQSYIPLLLGKKAGNIDHVRKMTGAHIYLDGSLMKLKGDRPSVFKAIAMFEKIVGFKPTGLGLALAEDNSLEAGGKCQRTEKIIKRNIIIDAREVGYILGNRGGTINRLRRESGAKIDVNSASDKVEISGKESCVLVAVELIEKLRADLKYTLHAW